MESTALTRTERLDRLPFTRKHGKLLGASGIAYGFTQLSQLRSLGA